METEVFTIKLLMGNFHFGYKSILIELNYRSDEGY